MSTHMILFGEKIRRNKCLPNTTIWTSVLFNPYLSPCFPFMHDMPDLCFREIDQDGDGRISYKDFEYVMKYNTTDHI